jgi:hypothetical protein
MPAVRVRENPEAWKISASASWNKNFSLKQLEARVLWNCAESARVWERFRLSLYFSSSSVQIHHHQDRIHPLIWSAPRRYFNLPALNNRTPHYWADCFSAGVYIVNCRNFFFPSKARCREASRMLDGWIEIDMASACLYTHDAALCAADVHSAARRRTIFFSFCTQSPHS